MKLSQRMLVVSLGTGLALSSFLVFAAGGGNAAEKAAKISKAIEGKTYSMSEAIAAAEKETGGKAVNAQVEIEGGKAMVEVVVLVNKDGPKLLEVEVDGATRKVTEVEDYDGEEEDEDDDDGDKDDDKDDDKDGDDD